MAPSTRSTADINSDIPITDKKITKCINPRIDLPLKKSIPKSKKVHQKEERSIQEGKSRASKPVLTLVVSFYS
jgi:hypothetical protein